MEIVQKEAISMIVITLIMTSFGVTMLINPLFTTKLGISLMEFMNKTIHQNEGLSQYIDKHKLEVIDKNGKKHKLVKIVGRFIGIVLLLAICCTFSFTIMSVLNE